MVWSKINSLLMPRFDWIQVAVSTFCNASCGYCPHTVYRRQWRGENLSLETFRCLAPAFSKSRLIYLQGWGEPFLNPELFAMIHMAKNAGCRVGTTTNGMLLDAGTLNRLVDLEVDLVAFSLAGTDEKNDLQRRGTRIETVLEAMRNLNQIKRTKGKSKPEVHIAYMLLRSGLDDLAKLPLVLQGLGVTQVVISTLDFVPSKDLAAEAFMVSDGRDYPELESCLDKVAELGRNHGLNIHYQLQGPGRRRQVCTENVARALVVSADGEVSPCVFTNLPVTGVTLVADGVERPYRGLTFGNVRDRSLSSLWGQIAYRNFRRSFYEERPPSVCQSCAKR